MTNPYGASVTTTTTTTTKGIWKFTAESLAAVVDAQQGYAIHQGRAWQGNYLAMQSKRAANRRRDFVRQSK